MNRVWGHSHANVPLRCYWALHVWKGADVRQLIMARSLGNICGGENLAMI